MDDVLAFLQQVGPTALIVALMVLMHAFGHGARGHGGHGEHHQTARPDDGAPDPGGPRPDVSSRDG